MVYANGEQLMSPWPCPPDNRVRDFNGLANPLPCLSARGHAFTRCTEVRIGSEGAGQGGVTAVRAPLWGAQSEDCIRSSGPPARREGGWRTRGWSLRSGDVQIRPLCETIGAMIPSDFSAELCRVLWVWVL